MVNLVTQGRNRWSPMAGLVFGNGIKLTSSIKSINFQIGSFEINSARLEYILNLSSFGCRIAV